MRSLWAVASAASVSSLLLLLAGGCAGPTSQVKEFNRMEVGEGPGAMMSRMIELHKKPRSPVPTPSPVEPAPVTASIEPPAPELSKKKPAPETASVEPPAFVLSKKKPAPVTTTVHLPLPAAPKKTPAPVAEPVEPPAAAPPEKEPATVIASVKPPAPEESAPAPAPPVPSRENKGPAPQASIYLTKHPPEPPPKAKPADKDYSGGPKYRIGAEDVLHIDVWGNPELTRDVTVRPDGKISLPLIQDIQAEGLTAAELSDGIHQKLLAFLKGPEVAVIVTQVNAPKVFVIGQVTRPGPYPLRGDISVLQALSLAGGFTPFASPKSIKVIHNREGKREVRKVNYYDLISKGGEGNNLLKPGDTIVVP